MTTHVSSTLGHNARPYLHGTELGAFSAALFAGQYGHGEQTELFERRVADYLGVADVVAVSSGTAALHLALLSAGVGEDDEVIVPSQTFAATVQAIVQTGANPIFVEVDPDTLCVRAADIAHAITSSTRAVLPVLYGGRAVDLSSIQATLDSRRISVVEDAAHAFGSYHGQDRVGATGLLTCFSFGPIKNLTCLQGGAVVPRDAAEATALRQMRQLGIAQPQGERIRSTTYTVTAQGFRYMMSNLNAAIGLAQLKDFPVVEANRKELWRSYASALAGCEQIRLIDCDIERTVPFNCVVRVPAPVRGRLHQWLHQRGIAVGVHYPPNHLQPAFAMWEREPLPVTEAVSREILSLPFHLGLTSGDIRYIASSLREGLELLDTSCGSTA